MQKWNRKDKMTLGGVSVRISASRWRRCGRTVGLVSVGLLTVMGVVAVNSVVRTENVWADWQVGDSSDLPSGAQIELNTSQPAQSEVTLTMDSGGTNGKLNASAATTNPDAAADVVKRTATVGLTNTDGYVVNIKANSTDLTGTNTSNTIASVSANSTLGQMTNTWGWNGSIDDAVADCNPSGTFKPMKTTDQELGTGGAIAATQNKKVTMCFGSRIDGSKTADTYTNTVTLSVVAQPGKTATFNGIKTMQEMTTSICSAASINDTAFLEDTRDRVNGAAGTGTKYWVTKLLDGNCWMSQNLALDLSTSKTLTSSDSDVSSWTPGQNTSSKPTEGSITSTDTWSWNLGNYVIINPTATTACSSNNTGLSACADQFEPVGTRTPSSDPNFYKETEYTGTDGSTCTKTANTTYSTATSGACAQYDAHYLAGNYYQWNAATAGTGASTANNTDAPGSICPKNWKLPNSGDTSSNMTKGSFRYLLTQYGVQSKVNVAAGAVASPVNGNEYDIVLSPLFFVRGGLVNTNNQQLSLAGQWGGYWSSRAHSYHTDYAYYFYFNDSGVSPSTSGYARYVGNSLRCLIPTP